MDTQELLDMAAFSVAKLTDHKKGSQVNALLEVMSSREGISGILAVQERLVYQSARRGLLPKEFCSQVYNDLCEIVNVSNSDDAEKGELARQYLTHIKRLYKGIDGVKNPSISQKKGAFDKLARYVLNKGKGGSQDKKRRR